MLRTVYATRYVTPLREGGSLPAIVEADDTGCTCSSSAGRGRDLSRSSLNSLPGEIGRDAGPEGSRTRTHRSGRGPRSKRTRRRDPRPAARQRGPESRNGLLARARSCSIPPQEIKRDPDTASDAVWFDAFVTNIDRTANNPNLLCWHKSLYFIDHGAAMYFHHNWQDIATMARSRFPAIRNHVLLRWAIAIAEADSRLRARLNEAKFARILDAVPDAWLPPEGRAGLRRVISCSRLSQSQICSVEEAMRARAELV